MNPGFAINIFKLYILVLYIFSLQFVGLPHRLVLLYLLLINYRVLLISFCDCFFHFFCSIFVWGDFSEGLHNAPRQYLHAFKHL